MSRRGRKLARFVLATCLFAATPGVAATLSGTVRDTTGAPLAGATVRLWSAGPLHGAGTLCPSCYPDCGKSARTDRAGRFEVASVDDSLRFRLLVVAGGFRPAFVERVEPARGPVEARLAPRTLTEVADSLVAHGKVTDDRGRAVNGALLTPIGYRMGRLSFFGPVATDPMAVTDESGRFDLVVGTPRRPGGFMSEVPDSAVVWYVRVEARGLAPCMLQDLSPGPERRRIALTVGSNLSGRVVQDGHPLAGVVMEAAQVSRRADGFLGPLKVATDSSGAFFLGNLRPGTSYVLYGRMESFAPFGSAPLRLLTTPPDGATTDLGPFAPGPRRRLSGRITLEDGAHPPAGTRVMLTRPVAFDAVELRTDEEGRFAFDALPPESLEVTPPSRDHHLDPATPGLDARQRASLRIADAGDVELDLRMLAGAPAAPGRRPSAQPRDTTRTGPPNH